MSIGVRELYLTLVYCSFFVVGLTAPFVFSLGYVWVDIFYPQALSDVLGSFPVAAAIGAAAFFGYVFADRRAPHFSTHTALTLIMAAWVTITLLWAEAPVLAYDKWNWAFKTVAFSAFLPFVFRSRVQIEAFILVFFLAAMAYVFPVAVKTLISGAGYGRRIGLVNTNSGLSESSALAALSLAIIPLALFLREHSVLIPRFRLRGAVFLGFCFLGIFSAIGTFARTAVVGFVVLGGELFVRSRRKILFVAGAAALTVAVLFTVQSTWDNRISTIEDYNQENSALTRLLVWRWTLSYALSHPLGGGFMSYVISRIEYPPTPEDPAGLVVVGRAFHSSFFEVLGEHGFPGLALFLGLVGLSLRSVHVVRRRARDHAELQWAFDLAGGLRAALLVMLACGAFVGIAFQPAYWYLFAMIATTRQHVARVLPAETGRGRPALSAVGRRDVLAPVARLTS
jgi:probable O-glycosylation ligase (exosortase A-associated)